MTDFEIEIRPNEKIELSDEVLKYCRDIQKILNKPKLKSELYDKYCTLAFNAILHGRDE